VAVCLSGRYYGALVSATSANGEIISYPTATYEIDDVSSGSQEPYFDTTGAIIYFRTPQLSDGSHKIDITVKTANDTNQFLLDFFLVTPSANGGSSGVETSRTPPTSTSTSSGLPIVTSHATPVGAIVGGVVGGIAGIAILSILAWYFLRRRSRGGQAYYFDKPTPGDILAGEDHVEPFNANATTPAPSSTGFTGQGPQSAYSDGSSNQPLNRQTLPSQYSQSGPSDASGPTHVSGITAQPRVGKAALIAQQFQDVQPPVQYEDSGVRFNPNGEEAGPSHLPAEVPPSYTPQ